MLGLWGKLDCAIDIYIDLWYLNLMSVECFFFFFFAFGSYKTHLRCQSEELGAI